MATADTPFAFSSCGVRLSSGAQQIGTLSKNAGGLNVHIQAPRILLFREPVRVSSARHQSEIAHQFAQLPGLFWRQRA